MGWFKSLFSTHRSASHKSPGRLADSQATCVRVLGGPLLFELRPASGWTYQWREPRILLFYRLLRSPFNQRRRGRLIVAHQLGGEGLFKASGNPPLTGSARGQAEHRSIGVAASIDDEGEVGVTYESTRRSGPSIVPGQEVSKRCNNCHSRSHRRYIPEGEAIQNYVGVGFDASGGRVTRSVVYNVVRGLNNPTRSVDVWENINGVAKQVTSSLQRPMVPAVADGGAFVVQTETPSNEPIILYRPQFDTNGVFTGTNQTFIAGRSRFSDLGVHQQLATTDALWRSTVC